MLPDQTGGGAQRTADQFRIANFVRKLSTLQNTVELLIYTLTVTSNREVLRVNKPVSLLSYLCRGPCQLTTACTGHSRLASVFLFLLSSSEAQEELGQDTVALKSRGPQYQGGNYRGPRTQRQNCLNAMRLALVGTAGQPGLLDSIILPN